MPIIRLGLLTALILWPAPPAAGQEKDYPIRPVPFTEVRIQDDFWSHRMEVNRRETIPHAFRKCEENGRMDNFAIAGGLMEGEHRGQYPFDDTDPYKILEGASYALAAHPDDELDRYLDGLIAKIAAAQEEDGYIYTCRTNGAARLDNWMGPERWSNLARSHELYNAGHLYEAAAAHYQATGKRTLLEVALKNAELVCRTFGPEKKRLPPGHQIIEMGLSKLYRVTGDDRYLEQAKFFLDMRGRAHEGRRLWGEYTQDHKPVLEQDGAVGHAVRATYMYSGMADVAALTGDPAFLEAIDRIWENVVTKKLYLTGGVGARGRGEAFGADYELPNMSAYCETCAAIGNVYWNHRLFLLHGDGKYIDVLERTLYNGLLSGVSMDGKRFFYPNPLESQGQHERSTWFGCACCPGNIARFMASVPGYVYAWKDDTLYVNLYAGGRASVPLRSARVELRQETHYPWEGNVMIEVAPDEPSEFALCLRIPGWAGNRPMPGGLYRYMDRMEEAAVVRVNGEKTDLVSEKGYARIRRVWKAGDTVELELPVRVRRVLANEKVEAARGRVALERGPIVYCAEWPDHQGGHVLNLLLPDDAELGTAFQEDLLNGVQVIRGRAFGYRRSDEGDELVESEQALTAIPYYAWAHRGRGEMAVWLARDPSAVNPLAAPTLASMSRASASGGSGVDAINDQREPESSIDHANRFFHWWPRKGTLEWVQYDFPGEEEVYSVEVYWFDDTGIGECRLPASWRVLYRDGESWRPVYTEDVYGLEKDRYNRVIFETVRTGALRLEIQLKEKWSAGIHEWRVNSPRR